MQAIESLEKLWRRGKENFSIQTKYTSRRCCHNELKKFLPASF